MEGPVPRRGDIFYADLNPVVGSEQGGKRPVLIIQNDQGNKHSPTVIVAPLSSRSRSLRVTHVLLPKEKVHRLKEDSVVMLEQIRTLDKKRLSEEKTARVGNDIMESVDEAIVKSIDLEPYIRSRAFIYSSM